MGFWSNVRARFSADPPSSNKPLGLEQFAALFLENGPTSIGRPEALSVPAVQRGRNQLSAISTLPLVQIGPLGETVDNPLLRQFDPDVANVVHIAQTVEDLLFDGIAWWEVMASDFAGFPTQVRRLNPVGVSLVPPVTTHVPAPLPSGRDPRGASVWVDGREVPAERVIRFDSPNPGILAHCGRTIRRAIALERAAEMYANDPRPLDYFTPADGADPIDDDDVPAILNAWKAARKARSTAWVPASMKYNQVDAPSPQELQLVELQRQVWVELAQLMGVDAEDLGVSTTSRTYQNDVDRRLARVQDVLSPYMLAISQRLSMGDVTRRGHRVEFDLTAYLRADPASRIAYYTGLKALGVLTPEQIAAAEGLPAPTTNEEAPVTDAVNASAATQTFADPSMTFADVELTGFSVDTEARTIEGIAVPYNRVAEKSGSKFKFAKGSLRWSDPSRVKLLRDHDPAQPLGRAVSMQETDAGLHMKFKVAKGAAGDDALALAADGVLDGMSVGVDFNTFGADPKDSSVNLVTAADLREVSLVAVPAFDDARVTRVAASAFAVEETPMPEETPAVVAPVETPATRTYSADEIDAKFAALSPAQPEERPVIDPTRPTAQAFVAEPASYTFGRDGSLRPAAHDFGMDLVRALNPSISDRAAYDRVMEFAAEQFNVATTNVSTLNPTIIQNRYIDEREFQYPLFSAVNRGAPPNGVQPFSWPAFSSASSLVAAHTEGTEPNTGTYVTTNQSVTPVALSGKARINREVFDMGGTPGLSDILWRRIIRDWYETLEAAIVTKLNAASPTALGTFTAGGGTGKATLVAELRNAMAALQYARGGFRFDTAFAQADLYGALVAAVDTTGRPIFPQDSLGIENADGTSASRWATLNVGGVPFLPTWALAAGGQTDATSSYLIDRTAVDAWATPPLRLQMDLVAVSYVDLGVWGYHAEAINDLAGVREISYDPAA